MDLIFCAICDQDVSHDGAYAVATQAGFEPETYHRDCLVDSMSDMAQLRTDVELLVKFVVGPNFDPER